LHAADHAEIISSTAAAAKKLATAIVDLSPNTSANATRAEAADHQIPIDGKPPARPRGFLPWRLSDTGPQHRKIDCRRAGIRNPSQIRPISKLCLNGEAAPIAATR
jgi:hypothetical protein